MPSLEPLSVLLLGQGTQPGDRQPVTDAWFRARFARVVVPAVTWAI